MADSVAFIELYEYNTPEEEGKKGKKVAAFFLRSAVALYCILCIVY